MDLTQARPARFSTRDATRALSAHYGIEADLEPLGAEIDQNFHALSAGGHEFVFKIANADEDITSVEMQNAVLDHLAGHDAGFVLPEVCPTVDGTGLFSMTDKGINFLARLLTWVKGASMAEQPAPEPSALEDLGRRTGRLDRALLDFKHGGLARMIPWDLKHALTVAHMTGDIEDPVRRRMVEYGFMQFEARVMPELATLRMGPVHNDIKPAHLVCTKKGPGLIDFGDLTLTHTVFEPAVLATYLMHGVDDPIKHVAPVIRGYHAMHPLTDTEIDLLFPLIVTRVCVYLTMAAHKATCDPDNTHIRQYENAMHTLLEKLIAVNPIGATHTFRRACGLNDRAVQQATRKQALIDQRAAHVGRSLALHYDKPLRVMSAGLQYMHDDEGNSYLDCVNNVCQLGHCHPRVVAAGRHQMTRLNTNSRYLYDQYAEYAARLAGLFPDPLEVCYFVNSGSEANDLALRLARTFTHRLDAIVIENAYHGGTGAAMEVSPNRFDAPGGPGAAAHVHKALLPDTYRGPFSRDQDPAVRYADDVKRIAEGLVKAGTPPAAFIAESMVGTGGEIVFPDGYLAAAHAHARGAGAVTIADEVQMGFGRTGTPFWGFAHQGVVPDIVTFGKPMGNGHPMAGLVTTRAISDAFENGVPYFNTFGGNPVSCAIGNAVLDVLEEERLPQNVEVRAVELMEGLDALQQRHELIGDVRGMGLYIGIDLVRDRATKEPATAETRDLIERAKARGLLLNSNGRGNSVIKVKPPLIVGASDTTRILETLDAILAEVHPAVASA